MHRWVVLALVLATAGCKDKLAESFRIKRNLLERNQMVVETCGTDLKNGTPVLWQSTAFDPPLRWVAEGGNTDIIPIEASGWGQGPDSEGRKASRKASLNLGFGERLLQMSRRVTPDHDQENLASLREPGSTLMAELDAALAIRYAVVYRAVAYTSPTETSGGIADVELVVCDIPQMRLMRRQRVLVLTPVGERDQELIAGAHDEVMDAVVRVTGGRVDAGRRLFHANPELAKALMENDALAPKSLGTAGPPEVRVASNLRQARDILAKHGNPINVCHTLFLTATLDKLPPDLLKQVHEVCDPYQKGDTLRPSK